MKISLNWLRDYMELDLEPEKISDILTEIGLEVEGTEVQESVRGGLRGVAVGEVLTCGKHPNADRLSVTTVDVGAGSPLHIVCGAPNVAAGQKVLVATIGTTLYGRDGEPWKIKKGKIRGQVSQGMICAEDELGLGDSHEGILVLPEAAVVGAPATDYFEVTQDVVFDIGLTPNRSDATSHLGTARDLAAALKINHGHSGLVSTPDLSPWKVDRTDLPIRVTVENQEACPRYAGVTLKGVQVSDSPGWLQAKLRSIGVRPINNVVDITNFVLHEYGQPLHAFDYARIGGREIRVKTLATGTKFTSLDEQVRQLDGQDLMICDGADKGLCIAGVFGGIDSGVTAQTVDIFLESAHFNAKWVRRSSTRHLLFTDASKVFEKGSDPNICVVALQRAALLMKDLAGAEIASEIVDIYPDKVQPRQIELSYAHLNRLVGTVIPAAKVQEILDALGIAVVSKDEQGLSALVPTDKADVTREADLIEEVLRIYGFNNVPFPGRISLSMSMAQHPSPLTVKNRISDYLVAQGLVETMALTMLDNRYDPRVYQVPEEQLVRINNTSNVQVEIMRPTMLVSALETIRHNQNRQQGHLRFFEFGHTYRKVDDAYLESHRLSITLSGWSRESWLDEGLKGDQEFYALKSLVENILSLLGIQGLRLQDTDGDPYTFGLQLARKGKPLATLGKLDPTLCRHMDIRSAVYFADIDWDQTLASAAIDKVTVKTISKFPSVRRDLALVVDKAVTFEALSKVIKQQGAQVLSEINLFDVYEDQSVLGEGKKSYALSLLFHHEAKTFADQEVDTIIQKMVDRLGTEVGAKLR